MSRSTIIQRGLSGLIVTTSAEGQETTMTSHIVTVALLNDHLRCATKSYLRMNGCRGEKNDYLTLRMEIESGHRRSATDAVTADYTTEEIAWAAGAALQDIPPAKKLVIGAMARADNCETVFDALQLIPGESQVSPVHYQPVRFCPRPQPDSSARLLLAFDAHLLGRIQGQPIDEGILICGPTLRCVRVKLRPHLSALAPILARIRLQFTAVAPALSLNRHCDVCDFKASCRKQAIDTDNLTLLRGMTREEMVRHNAKGIFTIKQLSYTFRTRRPAKRQKQRFPHSFALQALALRESKVHVHGEPELSIPKTQIYLDIEGLPDKGFYYLIGVLVVKENIPTFQHFWADEVSQQPKIFMELAEFLSQHEGCVVFHYGNYEANALRRMLTCIDEEWKPSIKAALDAATNLLSVVGQHVYFPTFSNGLKDVAGFLGYHWTDPDASGLQSIVWREQWETEHDEAVKCKLLRYNHEDCLALWHVTGFIASIVTEGTPESPRASQPDKVVYTTEMQPAILRKHKFGKSNFCLPDLEFVNRCAYFDYQRDRVYLREKATLDMASLRRASKRRRRPKVNKRAQISCKRCPNCASKRLSQGPPLSLRMIDMKFLASGGVKKWVTLYSSWRYRCDKCGHDFRAPGYPQTATQYGDGLVNWAVYQNVALGQNMSKVEQCLSDVFKLDVPQCTLHRFKAAVADRYKSTNETILSDLLRGPCINIDETEARLRKEKAHVWVFAGAGGAYYEYRDSRNGQFLHERLKGFSGVLISDFFTAYDSLDCPQQKCLIHLIRDMNEDMKANAFDGELKCIVQGFAEVVRPIIITVDRHGLTKSHLQKHKIPATKFIERVVAQRLSSEPATKYQKRIEKYGGRLFTFLDYNGVTWNNNNAEHAIKGFARYRRFADGRFTGKSVTDYLAILSVFQTCEYRGLNVLKYLLSGSKELG